MAVHGDSPDLDILQKRVDESVGTVKRVFDAASDCMAIVGGVDGKFLGANPAFETLTGYPSDELHWMHVWEIWRPDMADDARRSFRDIAEAGSGADTEIPVLKKNGSIITVEFAARTMRYQGQDALLIIIVDITQRKEAARREAELTELRDAMEGIQSTVAVAVEAGDSLATQAGALREKLAADPAMARYVGDLTEAIESVRTALVGIQEQAETALATEHS